jgi:predicted small lipoprotein YifL
MTVKTCLILASLAFISACGISGGLEKAPPLWGDDRVAYEAEQAKIDQERKAKEAQRAARNQSSTPAQEPASAPKN